MRRYLLLLALLLFAADRGSAQKPPPGVTLGPSRVTLSGRAGQVSLPANYVFVDGSKAAELLTREGENDVKGVVGLVAQRHAAVEWSAILRYADCGYIKDDEAGKMDADSILNDIKSNTEKENEQGRAHGAKPISVVGWYKKPAYDRSAHVLSWSVLGHEEGAPFNVLNVTSVLFGRYGILISTVVGDEKDAVKLQPQVERVNASLSFPTGADYASYRSGDKVSDVTMTGLVTGGAAAVLYGAAKIGLLAKLGKLIIVAILAMKKAFILVIAAAAGFVRKLKARVTGKDPATASANSGTPGV